MSAANCGPISDQRRKGRRGTPPPACNMPGFAWSDAAKFKKFAHVINFQMVRVEGRPGQGTIVVDDKGYVDWTVIASHEQFMADVLTAFPHGPPCIGYLRIATRFYVELFHSGSPPVPDSWIDHEVNKIHLLWRFIWNCFQRSPRSKHFALDRLKTILSLQRAGREHLDPDAEDVDPLIADDWHDDEDARLATPARPVSQRELVAHPSVVSVTSSGPDEDVPKAPPASSEDNGRSERYVCTDDLLGPAGKILLGDLAIAGQLLLDVQEDCLRQDTIESPKGAQLEKGPSPLETTPPSRKQKVKTRLRTMGVTPTNVAAPKHMELSPLPDVQKHDDLYIQEG